MSLLCVALTGPSSAGVSSSATTTGVRHVHRRVVSGRPGGREGGRHKRREGA